MLLGGHRSGGAGLGIAWDELASVLDETARAEWKRLATVFADDPFRFREGGRGRVHLLLRLLVCVSLPQQPAWPVTGRWWTDARIRTAVVG